ncbi:unnamed protein product [Closterium sp. Naga37s-1]|nr:unnamed protein product [Closterium sp. Naga37s-1]
MAVAHADKLHKRYPHQLCAATLESSLRCGAVDIRGIDEHQLRQWGRIDVMIAGWECQGYSRAGAGRGLRDEQSGLFRELKRVLELIKQIQGDVLYIVKNVDMEGDIREQVQVAHEELTPTLGPGVVANGAQKRSRTHRVRRYWTNGVSDATLQYRVSLMERPVPLLVEDILEPRRMPAPVERPGHPTQFPCNEVGKPRQAWPTFVAHGEAVAFRLHDGLPGPGMVYDCTAREWQDPTALERELAMGFMENATAHPEVIEEERRRALGRAMDLNVMHWLVATIRMYHSELRWERKRDKAAAVQPPTERSAAKEALARAMLGEIQEHDELQHERGHPLERRWVYPWEEEDERPADYAEQADIWLPGDREEQAVDKKREDFTGLEEAIERQRSRESYEREFGSGDFALMAATKEEEQAQEGTQEAGEEGGDKGTPRV